MQLTDEQWQAVERCIPEDERRPPGKRGITDMMRVWMSCRTKAGRALGQQRGTVNHVGCAR
jgi:hypothetical protein